MTVSELIAALQFLDGDLPVVTYGREYGYEPAKMPFTGLVVPVDPQQAICSYEDSDSAPSKWVTGPEVSAVIIARDA